MVQLTIAEQIDTLWTEFGFIRWPLMFSFMTVIGLALFSTIRLFRPGATADLHTKAWLDAILFWGGFATISGLLGTLIGITIASQSVEAAGEVNVTLMWGGIKISLLSSLFGVLILAFASLLWFVLQLRWRLLVADEMEDAI
jgi:hypothetical protein